MANTAIRDLGAGTLAADSAIPIQNTSAATVATQASYSKMGGLVHAANTITTANLTASVGTLHKVTIAGLTANRDFILPDTAAIGERVGVYVVDGDDAFVLQIKTAATASEINGADASSTLWSSVFIKNEIVIFECIKAGGAGDTDWIVIQDGRIPCLGAAYASAAVTTNATWTNTRSQLGTTVKDVGGIVLLASDEFVVRRAGQYMASCSAVPNISVADQGLYGSVLMTAALEHGSYAKHGSDSGSISFTVSRVLNLAAGAYVRPGFISSLANMGSASGVQTWLDLVEVL